MLDNNGISNMTHARQGVIDIMPYGMPFGGLALSVHKLGGHDLEAIEELRVAWWPGHRV